MLALSIFAFYFDLKNYLECENKRKPPSFSNYCLIIFYFPKITANHDVDK